MRSTLVTFVSINSPLVGIEIADRFGGMTGKVGTGVWVKTLYLDSKTLLSITAALSHIQYWSQVNVSIRMKSVGICCKSPENVTALNSLSSLDN